jgi:fluoride exporter
LFLDLVWVAVGGAVGSVARFLVSGGVNDRFHPWGTVLVNVVGSFVLGFLVAKWGWDQATPHRLGLTVGLLGGFTTFSTFSLDAIRLWENGETAVAAVVVVVSIAAGLGAAAAGLALGRS